MFEDASDIDSNEEDQFKKNINLKTNVMKNISEKKAINTMKMSKQKTKDFYENSPETKQKYFITSQNIIQGNSRTNNGLQHSKSQDLFIKVY